MFSKKLFIAPPKQAAGYIFPVWAIVILSVCFVARFQWERSFSQWLQYATCNDSEHDSLRKTTSCDIYSTNVLLYVTLYFFLSRQMRICPPMKDAFIWQQGLTAFSHFRNWSLMPLFLFMTLVRVRWYRVIWVRDWLDPAVFSLETLRCQWVAFCFLDL